MFAVRHSMKLQHCDSSCPRLVRCSFEVVERPVRSRVTRAGNQERMVQARLISEAASPVIRVFGRAAAPGEPDAEFFKNRECLRGNGISGISETDGSWNVVLSAV